jgi:hypothetical protein
VPEANATAWGDQPDELANSSSPTTDIAVSRAARRPPRLVPALLGLFLGLTIAALNVWVVVGDLRLRIDGAAVLVTVSRCEQGGRSRTCEGTYTLNGRRYDDRLLLGGEDAHVGQTIKALVDRRHPGDASTTGVAAPIEAALFALGGLFIAGLAGRRSLSAASAGHRRRREPGARRPLRSRARVWEAPQRSSDESAELLDRPDGLPGG